MAEGALVRFENVDGIGVITVDNPPVNALSRGAEGIVENVERGNADPAVKAMVLIGARAELYRRRRHPSVRRPPRAAGSGKAHPRGARCERQASGRGDPRVCSRRRAGDRPAANYRVAVPSAKVGLPEVLIGILPGSGGTQRLPRLIGPKAAMEMIVSGRHVPAEEAKRLGIIDELVEDGGDLRQAAIAMARRLADTRPLPRIRDRDEKLAEAKADPGIFEAMRRSIARRARNQKAPYHWHCRGRGGVHHTLRRRRQARARALRRARKLRRGAGPALRFFCRARSRQTADIPRETPLRPIQSAAIVGAGTMAAASR